MLVAPQQVDARSCIHRDTARLELHPQASARHRLRGPIEGIEAFGTCRPNTELRLPGWPILFSRCAYNQPVADLPDELVSLERAAVTAYEKVRTFRQEYGPPDTDGIWTEAQHAARQEAWDQWREAAGAVQAAITAHAEAAGENRPAIEMAVKKAARAA
jgi:hypothetical protein